MLTCLTLQAQSLTRPPYLQNATHEAITLKWRTDSLTDSRVRFGNAPGSLNQIVGNLTGVHDHTVRISGLQPYTQYYYSVGTSSADWVGDDSLHHFRTNPVIGTQQPIKVWAIGDFGRGNRYEYWVRDSYTEYAKTHRPADVWLWLGDNAYDTGADSQYTQKVFNIYDSVFANQVFWPTPGNHDYLSVNQSALPPYHAGPYYSIVEVPTNGEAGGVPSGGEMYYSFDYGNVHFVSLNSELGSWIFTNQSPLTDWLKADLQATVQPWKIVYFHQPPHSKGSHNSDNFWETNMVAMRQNIMPIVEAYGVDLVLSGHSHVYERSKLMYGFYGWTWLYNPSFEVDGRSGNEALGEAYHKSLSGPNPNRGTIYAVVGNGASTFAIPQLNHPMMEYGWGCDTCVGSLIVDVNRDTLRGHYLSSLGDMLDEFTIIKDLTVGAPSPAPITVSNVTVFPNPFSKTLSITYHLEKEARLLLQVTDMQGQVLHRERLARQSIGSHAQPLDAIAERLAIGSYTLTLSDGESIVHRQVVKVE